MSKKKIRMRYIFGPLVRIMAEGLNKIGISANMATCIMLIFSILSLISLVFFYNLLFFGFFVFACGIFDGIDGAIARINDKETQLGAFLDSTLDRISEFIIYFALLIYCWNQLLWNFIDMKSIVLISFLASIMISYIRARAENFFKGDFDIGLMARSERLFYLVITSMIAFFYNFMNEFLFLFMWLVIATVIFRFIKIKNQIRTYESELKN